MRNKIYPLGFLVSIFCFCVGYPAFAGNTGEAEYRARWLETEHSFTKQREMKIQEEERTHDIEQYLKLGRDYLSRKDYPLALISFRKVIELESASASKNYTNEVAEYIRVIEKNLKADIEKNLSQVLKEDIAKRKQGLNQIIERMTSPYAERLRAQQEAALLLEEKKREKDELSRRRITLQKEMLAKRMAAENELETKKLEIIKRQMQIDNILFYAKELIAKGKFSEAIIQTDKALAIDDGNLVAKELKNRAIIKIEKQKFDAEQAERKAKEALERIAKEKDENARLAEERRQKKEREAREAAEQKRQEQIAVHFNKGKTFFERNDYVRAIGELKTVLSLDPDNVQAKLYLVEIKSSLDKANDVLYNKNTSNSSSSEVVPQAKAAEVKPADTAVPQDKTVTNTQVSEAVPQAKAAEVNPPDLIVQPDKTVADTQVSKTETQADQDKTVVEKKKDAADKQGEAEVSTPGLPSLSLPPLSNPKEDLQIPMSTDKKN